MLGRQRECVCGHGGRFCPFVAGRSMSEVWSYSISTPPPPFLTPTSSTSPHLTGSSQAGERRPDVSLTISIADFYSQSFSSDDGGTCTRTNPGDWRTSQRPPPQVNIISSSEDQEHIRLDLAPVVNKLALQLLQRGQWDSPRVRLNQWMTLFSTLNYDAEHFFGRLFSSRLKSYKHFCKATPGEAPR